jgi:hypothetical protein
MSNSIFIQPYDYISWSQWPHGLKRGFAAARLLRSWVRIPLGAWMFVCCECCVLSGRVLCDELITRPEESYRLWCVVVCDRNLKNEEAMTRVGSQRHSTKRNVILSSSSSSSHHELHFDRPVSILYYYTIKVNILFIIM